MPSTLLEERSLKFRRAKLRLHVCRTSCQRPKRENTRLANEVAQLKKLLFEVRETHFQLVEKVIVVEHGLIKAVVDSRVLLLEI